MIAIGTTRKPTQRIRSFIKEIARVIPGSIRFTRGKQSFGEFCDTAQNLGSTRILLVGAYHGNPGRLGFLEFNGESWEFQPPTIIIKTASLLRESKTKPTTGIKNLYVIPDSSSDQNKAKLLASALDVPYHTRDQLPTPKGKSALIRVGIARYRSIDFLSLDEQHPVGPAIITKYFLTKPMGDQKRW
ncbi:MAG: Brix domain-containing protein [Candidatus Hermodarchaeia archaeon]|jgi:U3 small nucleolar ribonucleoprotein protein IMP4